MRVRLKLYTLAACGNSSAEQRCHYSSCSREHRPASTLWRRLSELACCRSQGTPRPYRCRRGCRHRAAHICADLAVAII